MVIEQKKNSKGFSTQLFGDMSEGDIDLQV